MIWVLGELHLYGQAIWLDGLIFVWLQVTKIGVYSWNEISSSSRKMFTKMFYATYQNFRIFRVYLLFISNGFLSLRNCPVWTRFCIFPVFSFSDRVVAVHWGLIELIWWWDWRPRIVKLWLSTLRKLWTRVDGLGNLMIQLLELFE